MANMFNYSFRSYFGFFHPILTWEYHCFGYRVDGHSKEEVSDGYEDSYSWSDSTRLTVTRSEKSHTVRIVCFKRHEEYPKNPIFVILELLMKLVSHIRVLTAKFFIAVYILLYHMITGIGLEHIGKGAGKIALAIYVCSFMISLAGFAVRKIFGLDQRFDDICDENGWKRWSEYEDN